jgi:nucleoside-diphosphate-sugar epimerase
MLSRQISKKLFLIYFSTCSIDDPEAFESPYVQHKINMETMVRKLDDYLIIRLPQVVGITKNPHTLVNYIYNKINCGEHFQIWRFAMRNFIDVDDTQLIALSLVKDLGVNKRTVNIACSFNNSILNLVEVFELVLNKKAHYTLIDNGASYTIDTFLSNKASQLMGIKFDETYLYQTIHKYYFIK